MELLSAESLHKFVIPYAAANLLQKLKTLIHQRCIKRRINDKNRHLKTPWTPRGIFACEFLIESLCKKMDWVP